MYGFFHEEILGCCRKFILLSSARRLFWFVGLLVGQLDYKTTTTQLSTQVGWMMDLGPEVFVVDPDKGAYPGGFSNLLSHYEICTERCNTFVNFSVNDGWMLACERWEDDPFLFFHLWTCLPVEGSKQIFLRVPSLFVCLGHNLLASNSE